MQYQIDATVEFSLSKKVYVTI